MKYTLVTFPDTLKLIEHSRFSECIKKTEKSYLCPEDLYDEIFAEDKLERKINSYFKIANKIYKCVENTQRTCCDCVFKNHSFCNTFIVGYCSDISRSDRKNVIFQEINLKEYEKIFKHITNT